MTEKTTAPPDFEDIEILTNDLEHLESHEGLVLTMEGLNNVDTPITHEDKNNK